MPAIPKPEGHTRVLVTGANGYIAMWIIHYLLEQGYLVRGTVRSRAKGEPLSKHFKEYYDSGKLDLAIVADSTQEGAYNDLVKDVSAIIHVASAVHDEQGDPSKIINPNVQATLQIMNSALAFGRHIKRVIYTSSTSAIKRSEVVEAAESITNLFNEENWNNDSPELVQRLGASALFSDKYQTSKVFAERAAWNFVEEHKDEISWDLCTLQPGFPFLQDWKDPSEFSWTSKFFHDLVFDPSPTPKDLLETSHASVDVRDCALAHVLALQKQDAGGQRILLVGTDIISHDWIEEANRLKSEYNFSKYSVVPPYPGIQKVYNPRFDNTKARHILGITFRRTEPMARGILEDYVRRGW
ncbi:NAD(P)-binding protein [Macrolepiota fuliginosa MF-IS2]|uniref:NAD(P)-binding protein n=1 Tax=Macrolepiota fuliginosa MF-IS2 TaxID=1400762 RepID=A0A9P5XIY5_9AGAR|nr:NAD(P)-binding protein [Macrolepiota fuliginosa MF-IS2]